MTYAKILQDIKIELDRATALYGSFNSEYEGYAIILEELDELWDEIKKKEHERSFEKMRVEAIQISAMAARFLIDLTGLTREDVFWKVSGSLGGIRATIFSHHDGYGRLKKKVERFGRVIDEPCSLSTHYHEPALAIITFIPCFIIDTMQDGFTEGMLNDIKFLR